SPMRQIPPQQLAQPLHLRREFLRDPSSQLRTHLWSRSVLRVEPYQSPQQRVAGNMARQTGKRPRGIQQVPLQYPAARKLVWIANPEIGLEIRPYPEKPEGLPQRSRRVFLQVVEDDDTDILPAEGVEEPAGLFRVLHPFA